MTTSIDELEKLVNGGSCGPARVEMSPTEIVLRWAIRYCSDMGAGPSRDEQAVLQEFVARLRKAEEREAALREALMLTQQWFLNPSLIDPLKLRDVKAAIDRALTQEEPV